MRLVAAWIVLRHIWPSWAQELTVPSNTQLEVTAGKIPVSRTIPSMLVNLSVALCSTNTPFPLFYVSNETAVAGPGIEGVGQQLVMDGGVAFWSGPGPATFWAYPPSGGTGSRLFEVSLTTGPPTYQRSTAPPLQGDTTSTQAIIFSPPFQDGPIYAPTYPNYTLPTADFNVSASPPTAPPQTLLVYQTSNISSTVQQFNQSFCGMAEQPGNVVQFAKALTTSVVLRDKKGWRTQWLLEGLAPNTNYTVYVIQNQEQVTTPLYIATKSANFACSLVQSVEYCPSVAYSVPLPPPQSPATVYNSTNLPSNVTQALLSSMGNFTQSLLTWACGRDNYSPVQSCASCQAAYREWLCAVSLPRCSEAPVNNVSPSPALTPYDADAQPRSLSFNPLGKPFSELRPCIETCHAVTRACPSFLGWQCPTYHVNAIDSYGTGFIDSIEKVPMGGDPGVAQDSFGNVWCNMP